MNRFRQTTDAGEGDRWPAAHRPRRVIPTGKNRAERTRLLMMTFALMAVISLLFQAADPQNWKWIWWITQTPLPHDSAPAPTPAHPNGLGRPPAAGAGSAAGPDLPASELGVAIPNGPDLGEALSQLPWDTVRDNTVFRQEEYDVWYGVWQALRETSQAQLAATAVSELGPIQLLNQLSEYRGRVVRVSGRVRRANYVPAAANDRGVPGYWQLWCEPPGGADFALVVYAWEYPPEAPRGMDVDVPCTIHGVVYKRWAYLASDRSRVAPLIMARTILPSETFREATGRQGSAALSLRQQWPVLGVVGALSFAGAWLMYSSGKRRRTKEEKFDESLGAHGP